MTHIGRYVIEAELGAGSMGVVYLAVDPRLERRIALKTYRFPDGVTPAQRIEFQQRFIREARAAAALSHPGIVAVYDTDVDPERELPFIAMEFVPGRSLKETLADEQRLSPEQAFSIVDTVAGALHVAHEAGIDVARLVRPVDRIAGRVGRQFGGAEDRLQPTELVRPLEERNLAEPIRSTGQVVVLEGVQSG